MEIVRHKLGADRHTYAHNTAKVEEKQEPAETREDSSSLSADLSQPLFPEPVRPTSIPSETATDPHTDRAFHVPRGTVMHIQVTTSSGRNTYLTFEG